MSETQKSEDELLGFDLTETDVSKDSAPQGAQLEEKDDELLDLTEQDVLEEVSKEGDNKEGGSAKLAKKDDDLLGIDLTEPDVLEEVGKKGGLIAEKDENLEDIEAELLLLSSPVGADDKDKSMNSSKSVVEVTDDDDDDLEILDDESESEDYEESDDYSDDSNSFIDGKITIFWCHGALLIWNADDAQMLREECRIVGKLTGCLPRAPRQNNHLGLPLQLMPEEARLLVDIDAAMVVEEVDTSKKTWRKREKAFKEVRNDNFRIQKKLYKENRKAEIRRKMKEIIAGKKAKKRKLENEYSGTSVAGPSSKEETGGDVEDDEDCLTVEDIAQAGEETSVKHSLVQIFTENPWKRSLKPAEGFYFPGSDEDILRYTVFKDLWKKGYYLTSGTKFGGDYLVYPGDPAKYHSHYIAVVMEHHKEMPVLDVICMGRLASNVRKTTILCSVGRKRKVIYQSLQWTGIS